MKKFYPTTDVQIIFYNILHSHEYNRKDRLLILSLKKWEYFFYYWSSHLTVIALAMNLRKLRLLLNINKITNYLER